jgi:tRNA dimethylallyltransferase
MNPIVFCLMGPTAIGKTDLACELTLDFPFEIINVDSSLMYKELNIGAAKPSSEVLLRFPHLLVNCCDLTQIYSVAQFCNDVQTLIKEILARGHYPLLVGGTMMYFHALQQGLSSLPESDEQTRAFIIDEVRRDGWEKIYSQFVQIDPVAASRIHPHDKQRIIRGLEIYRLSGKTWTDWLLESKKTQAFEWVNMALMPEPRAWLHERIAQRLEIMLEEGLLEEVRTILSIPGLDKDHPALRSVGYRQAIAYLVGGERDSDWAEKILFATRQLAKRQMTWLRGFENKTEFLCPDSEIKVKMIALIKKLLDNI